MQIQYISAQNEAANWYFGRNAGLTFNSGFPNALLDGELDTIEGCSTISDSQGNLLFYSDGITIWNKNHTVMQNGTGLTGNDSSTQSALIVPQPDSDTIYFIFTVDDKGGSDGLRFSEVDMTLNAGLGAVTANKNIPLDGSVTEKITAVESADGESIWVISHRWNSDEFIAFLVSDTGVNTTPVVSAVGSMHQGDINNTIGYLKASPNREKVACVKSYTNTETQVFDFNAATGILSNPITLTNYTAENVGAYGCEFSPDSRLLYVSEINEDTDISYIHQYNLSLSTPQAVINSDVVVGQKSGKLGALQQALDGRIYVAENSEISLGVITDPNELGTLCNFQTGSILLGGNSCRLGLPPFIQSYFFATNIFSNTCFGDLTEFSINTATTIDAITWNFGDPASGANNTSNLLNPTHIFTAIGTYDIVISIDTQGETQLVYRTLTISDRPAVLNLNPLRACEISDDVAEFNLVNGLPQTIIDDPNIAISFYETFQDAEDKTNSIFNINNYTNVSVPQTIYIRLQNSIVGDCFSISELELEVIENPIIDDTDFQFFCENSDDDTIIINVGNLDEPYSAYSFLWLDSLETTSEIEVQNAGTYSVRITYNASITPDNPDGCYVDRVITVESSSIATIDAIEIFNNDNITAYVSGLGDYEYAIDSNTGPYQDSNIFENLNAGLHTLYVRDKNDCGIVDATFSIIGYPTYFTPNGDGDNDFWSVKGISATFQSKSLIYIYNRYGKLLTQIVPGTLGWDGTFNGKPLPADDYWFTVKLEDGRDYVDHFTLKR